MPTAKSPWLRPSALILVAANLVPVLGVLVLGWSVGEVFILFWAESAIIGFFTVLKLALTRRPVVLLLIPFFCVHFGMFMLVHGFFITFLFLVDIFEGPPSAADALEAFLRTIPALMALTLSHLGSFALNYVKGGQWRTARPERLMVEPYGRIMAMQFAIILGGFLMFFVFGTTAPALLVLILFKIAADLTAHVALHNRQATGLQWILIRTGQGPATNGAPPRPEASSLPGTPGSRRRP